MELSDEIRREAELVYDAELSGGDYRPSAHLLQYFADEAADLEAAAKADCRETGASS